MTTKNQTSKRSSIRRWAMPVSLAAAMLLLPAAASSAEPHDRGRRDEDRQSRQNVRRGSDHGRSSYRGRGPAYRRQDFRRQAYDRHGRAAYYRHTGHYYRPSHVRYFRHGYRRPVGFYLATPYVVLHAPRLAAQVVFYPGEAPLYESGYCPPGPHYHPYAYEDGVHGRVSIQIGANF